MQGGICCFDRSEIRYAFTGIVRVVHWTDKNPSYNAVKPDRMLGMYEGEIKEGEQIGFGR